MGASNEDTLPDRMKLYIVISGRILVNKTDMEKKMCFISSEAS